MQFLFMSGERKKKNDTRKERKKKNECVAINALKILFDVQFFNLEKSVLFTQQQLDHMPLSNSNYLYGYVEHR